MVVVEVALFCVGVVVVVAVLLSAVRTVAVPRGEQVVLSRVLFAASKRVFDALVALRRTEVGKEAMRARYAPVTMLMLPLVWAFAVIGGFSMMFWATGVRPYREALVLAGSSFTTLGFRSTDDFVELELAVVAALFGLGLVALLLSFMPSLYSAFSRREALVARLEVRGGRPPSPDDLIVRAHNIGSLDSLEDTWTHWEQWFIEVEEAHTTYPALNYFRSPVPDRSWATASGAILDSAAMLQSAVAVPNSPQASLCIRAGYMALRRIADFFGVEHDADPRPGDPISVSRAAFDRTWGVLAAAGVPLVDDRDQAWRDFAGWRVNYDTVLLAICEMVDAPEGHWTR